MKSAMKTALAMLALLLSVIPFIAEGQLWAQDEEKVTYVQEAEIKEWNAGGKKYVVLDVRFADESKKYGHVPGSVVLPMWLEQENGPPTIDPAFAAKVKEQVSTDATVVILGRNDWLGRRSVPHMKKLGYTNVYVFKDGVIGNRPSRDSKEYSPGWMASDLPWTDGYDSYDHYSTDDPVTEVDAETMRQWIDDREKFIIIDVRTERELKRYGRPPYSVNIPLNIMVEKEGGNAMEQDPEFVAKVKEKAEGHEKVIMICTLSWRAGIAADLLQQAGMKDVYVFHHGIQGRMNGKGVTKGWKAHGLPYFEAKADESSNR